MTTVLNSERQGQGHSLATLAYRGYRKKPEATREQKVNGQRGGKKPQGLSCVSNSRADTLGPRVQTGIDLRSEY